MDMDRSADELSEASDKNAVTLSRQLAPRGGRWDPDLTQKAYALPCRQQQFPEFASQGAGEMSALISALATSYGCTKPVRAFCDALHEGSHGAAEIACAHGGVEASLALIRNNTGCSSLDSFVEGPPCEVFSGAIEALWLMIDDCDSCQIFIRNGGHSDVLKLASERGSENGAVSYNAFRLLAETLYNEPRSAALWRTADVAFVIDALEWALREDLPASNDGTSACSLGVICDVAALWVQRASAGGAEAVRPLVFILPLLLERMAARRDDAVLLQHGCRLLWALAGKGGDWPVELRDLALAALKELSSPQGGAGFLQKSPAEIAMMDQSRRAYQAVDMRIGTLTTSLSSMD